MVKSGQMKLHVRWRTHKTMNWILLNKKNGSHAAVFILSFPFINVVKKRDDNDSRDKEPKHNFHRPFLTAVSRASFSFRKARQQSRKKQTTHTNQNIIPPPFSFILANVGGRRNAPPYQKTPALRRTSLLFGSFIWEKWETSPWTGRNARRKRFRLHRERRFCPFRFE